jgi:metal-responsive CopG/Arc/MetJ family transcriptional regulator
MNEVTLQFDQDATKSIDDLMAYYKVTSRAELISKAISMLKVAAYIGSTQGELIARKNGQETRITMT